MPIKLTIVHEGSDWPIKKRTGDYDNSSLSKEVVTANTETGYTVVKYFADSDALASWRSANASELPKILTRRTANSITASFTEETVDSIP